MIDVSNISKNYGNIRALSDVNFTLERGEAVGLLGNNGAGKSTLMRILAGIIKPDSGQITFDGEIFLTDSVEIKKNISYLSEDNPLYDDMYVNEYLVYVAGIYKTDKKEIAEVIEQTGLQNEYRKKIKALSKGNRQRVGIAQALVHNSDFLILDEATSGLDPNQRESINYLLTQLSKNKTILFSTHILTEVRDICSRLILVDKGSIVANCNINELDSVEETFHNLTNENNS